MPRKKRYYNPWGQGGYEFDKWLLNLAPAEGQNAYQAQEAYNAYAKNSETGMQGNAQNYGEAGLQSTFQNMLSTAWQAERDNAQAAIEQAGQREAQGLNGPRGRPEPGYIADKDKVLKVARDKRNYIVDDIVKSPHWSLIYKLFADKIYTSAVGALKIINKISSNKSCKICITFGKMQHEDTSAETAFYIAFKNQKVFQLEDENSVGVSYAKNIINGISGDEEDKLIILISLNENSRILNITSAQTPTKMVDNADTFIHELQHADITFDSLKIGQKSPGVISQHDEMNKKDGKYWKTRYDFFYSYYDFWKEDLNNILADNPQYLISTCGSISKSNSMDANIKTYICNNIQASGAPH